MTENLWKMYLIFRKCISFSQQAFYFRPKTVYEMHFWQCGFFYASFGPLGVRCGGKCRDCGPTGYTPATVQALQNQVKRHLSAEALGPAEAARLHALSTPSRADPAVHSRPAGVGNPILARPSGCPQPRQRARRLPVPIHAHASPVTLRPAIPKP